MAHQEWDRVRSRQRSLRISKNVPATIRTTPARIKAAPMAIRNVPMRTRSSPIRTKSVPMTRRKIARTVTVVSCPPSHSAPSHSRCKHSASLVGVRMLKVIATAEPAGPSLGRPRPTNADSRHPRVTAPTPLWPGLPELICRTGRVTPAPGEHWRPEPLTPVSACPGLQVNPWLAAARGGARSGICPRGATPRNPTRCA